jgi:hypothetical protein
MKLIISMYTILVFFNNAFSQTHLKFPDGVYMSIEQLKSGTPEFNADFEVIRRTQGDIGFNGGNDYEIKSKIDTLGKIFIKKKMYAYVKSDSVFLNCIFHEHGTWYALAITKGNYIVFKGAMSNKEFNDATIGSSVLFGAIGGGIAGASAAKKRFLYVFSLRTGNVKPLTKNYVAGRLKDNSPELVEQYNAEPEPELEATLVKYIEKLNEVVTPASQAPAEK